MRKVLGVLGIVVASALIAIPEGHSQTKGKATTSAPAEKGVKELNFEADIVEAQFLRPDQGVAEAVVRKKRSSLLQVRSDFVDEILKSAEDL